MKKIEKRDLINTIDQKDVLSKSEQKNVMGGVAGCCCYAGRLRHSNGQEIDYMACGVNEDYIEALQNIYTDDEDPEAIANGAGWVTFAYGCCG